MAGQVILAPAGFLINTVNREQVVLMYLGPSILCHHLSPIARFVCSRGGPSMCQAETQHGDGIGKQDGRASGSLREGTSGARTGKAMEKKPLVSA